MRLRTIWIAAVLTLALLAGSRQVYAEETPRNCLVGAWVDNIATSAMTGCEWEATRGFSMGISAEFIHPLTTNFTPHFITDLTATAVIMERWIIGIAGGFGGHRTTERHLAGFADAGIYFTGTYLVSPYIESFAHFFPKWLGKHNEEPTLFRQRIGIRIKLRAPYTAIILGTQLVYPDLPHNTKRIVPGGFALVTFDL